MVVLDYLYANVVAIFWTYSLCSILALIYGIDLVTRSRDETVVQSTPINTLLHK